MKLTIAVTMISIVQSAAIKTLTIADSESNDILEIDPVPEVAVQSEESFPEVAPDWFIEFKEYIDSEDEIDFDIDGFLDKLEQNELEDFFDLIVLLIDGELLKDNETDPLSNI